MYCASICLIRLLLHARERLSTVDSRLLAYVCVGAVLCCTALTIICLLSLRMNIGGKNWTSVVLNGHDAYSYSCLSKVPQPGFIGLAWETVLPGSDVPKSWSANNVVFTLIPQNFSGPTNSA